MNLYIDESGTITTDNDPCNRFFVISCVETNKPYRVIREFRNTKTKFINEHPECKLNIKEEIKGSKMPYGMKEQIFINLCEKTDARFHFKIIDNHNLYPNLRKQSSLSFNYFIGIIVNNIHKINDNNEKEDLFMLIDERNQSVESTNSLEEYLKIKFTIENDLFKSVKVKYKDSQSKDLIQVADVFANTIFRIIRNKNDKRNRDLLKKCRVGINNYFPYKYNQLDICKNFFR